ncbi:hypothetical protein NL676_003411 [Syzygium grande]|nr:hypothetical protein NL676_003411 [Syzygium grande]
MRCYECVIIMSSEYELKILSFRYVILCRNAASQIHFDICYYCRFFVDDIPLRVFKNLGNKANYPTQGMLVEATIWPAEGWAGKIDWSKGPFKAQYQGFDIDGCVASNPSNSGKCDYTHGDASAQIQTLNADQIKQYRNVTRNYLKYDYCTDKTRYPRPPSECRAQI